MSNLKWEPVGNIDLSRRKAQEWAKIYKVELLDAPIDDRLWSEYEWAYNFLNSKYRPDLSVAENIEDFYEEFAEKEMRAIELRRDVFMGATLGEKEILNERYIETEWCRNRI